MKQLFRPAKVELFPKLVPAQVDETITCNKPGRVYCQGSYWPAKLYIPESSITLHPEHPVFAIGIEGITLLIVVL